MAVGYNTNNTTTYAYPINYGNNVLLMDRDSSSGVYIINYYRFIVF